MQWRLLLTPPDRPSAACIVTKPSPQLSSASRRLHVCASAAMCMAGSAGCSEACMMHKLQAVRCKGRIRRPDIHRMCRCSSNLSSPSPAYAWPFALGVVWGTLRCRCTGVSSCSCVEDNHDGQQDDKAICRVQAALQPSAGRTTVMATTNDNQGPLQEPAGATLRLAPLGRCLDRALRRGRSTDPAR